MATSGSGSGAAGAAVKRKREPSPDPDPDLCCCICHEVRRPPPRPGCWRTTAGPFLLSAPSACAAPAASDLVVVVGWRKSAAVDMAGR